MLFEMSRSICNGVHINDTDHRQTQTIDIKKHGWTLYRYMLGVTR